MDNFYANDANYDRTEVTKLRFVKHWLEICFFPSTDSHFLSSSFIFHSEGSVIVSFVVYFKTPVTVNEELAKLRDVVDNKKMLGNFTVEGLKITQPVNPTTVVSTEGSTSTVWTSTQRGNLTV